jgi:hypothetical protein
MTTDLFGGLDRTVSLRTLVCLAVLMPLTGVQTSCSSTPPVESIDTTLDRKGSTPNETVGLNKDGEAIVQKEDSASARLVTLEHVNENLKLDLKQQFFLLRECREDLALSENGGTGEYPNLTDFDALEAQYEKNAQLGLEDGKLKVVETSDLKQRLAAQEAFQKDLNAFIRTVKREREKCDFAVRNNQLRAK